MNALTKPDAAHAVNIRTWLANLIPAATVEHKADDVLRLVMSVEDAELAFETTIAKYVHVEHNDRFALRGLRYSVPVELKESISFISGLLDFPSEKKQNVYNGAGVEKSGNNLRSAEALKKNGQPGQAVTPTVIYETYQTEGVKGSRGSYAIAEFNGDLFGESRILLLLIGCTS